MIACTPITLPIFPVDFPWLGQGKPYPRSLKYRTIPHVAQPFSGEAALATMKGRRN
jgi:hypothetical protein